MIQKTEIFTKADQIPALMNLTREIKLIWKQEGDMLFQQGDIGHSFYVILAGAINGYAKSEELDKMG